MKKMFSIGLLLMFAFAAHAGPRSHYRHFGHHHHGRTTFSLHIGASPYHVYTPWFAPTYVRYPAYSYYSYTPAYGYDYVGTRPNYAVTGTLLGALTGGLIGHGIDRQGWEGAGIGAAAGLVLGSIAERSARVQERQYETAPVRAYVQPQVQQNSVAPDTTAAAINNASPAPAPAAPRTQPSAQRSTTSAMSSANALFGR